MTDLEKIFAILALPAFWLAGAWLRSKLYKRKSRW